AAGGAFLPGRGDGGRAALTAPSAPAAVCDERPLHFARGEVGTAREELSRLLLRGAAVVARSDRSEPVPDRCGVGHSGAPPVRACDRGPVEIEAPAPAQRGE